MPATPSLGHPFLVLPNIGSCVKYLFYHKDNDKDDLDDDSDDFDDGFWYKPQTPGEEALGRGKNLQNDDRPPSLCGAHTQIFVFSDLDDRHHPITTNRYKHIICAP